ncbi:hypothetical protein ACFS07_08040 [Undibacterium arcticum]
MKKISKLQRPRFKSIQVQRYLRAMWSAALILGATANAAIAAEAATREKNRTSRWQDCQ